MDNIKLIEDINGSPENLSLLQGAFMKSGLTFCIDGNYLALDSELPADKAAEIVRGVGLGTGGITMRIQKGEPTVNILHVGTPDPL